MNLSTVFFMSYCFCILFKSTRMFYLGAFDESSLHTMFDVTYFYFTGLTAYWVTNERPRRSI